MAQYTSANDILSQFVPGQTNPKVVATATRIAPTFNLPKQPANDLPTLKLQLQKGLINHQQFLTKFASVAKAPTNLNPYSLGNIASGVKTGVVNTGKGIGEAAINTVKAPFNAEALGVANLEGATGEAAKSRSALAKSANNSFISPLANVATIAGINLASKSILNNPKTSPSEKTAQLNQTVEPALNQIGFSLKDSGVRQKLKEGALVASSASIPVLSKGGFEALNGVSKAGKGALAEALNKAQAQRDAGVPVPKSALDNHLPKIEKGSSGNVDSKSQTTIGRADLAVENPSVEGGVGTPKNPNIPSPETPITIPKEGRFKNTISVSGDLSRQGKSGKEIADRLAKAESSSEIGQAKFLKQIPSVTKLSKKEFPQFVDTLDDLDKGKTPEISPKIQQAVDEWAKAIPTVRKQGEDAGIDVGNLGKHYFPRNHTELLSSQDGLTRAANHLVKTGQAKDLGEAIQSLNFMKNDYNTPFGHFEHSRTVDLPDYDKSKNALVNYVQGAYNKIGHAEQFGPKGEVADTLIGNIAAEGRNSERALKNYQIATGQFKYHNPGVDEALGKVRAFSRVSKLGLSSILNATQSTNTAAVAGIIRTAKSALKQLPKEDRDYIDSTGVRVDSAINALREQTGAAGTSKKALAKVFNAPGFGAVEKFNRGVAAVAGRDYAQSLAAKGTSRSINILRNKLDVEGEIGSKLTPEQEIQAGRKMVELTQFKTGGKDLPGWTNSPAGKTVAQFRTFAYKQTGYVYNQLIKEAVVNKNPLPLLRFLAVGIPLGYVAGGVRNKLSDKPFGPDPLKQPAKAAYQGLSNVGGLGLAQMGVFLLQNVHSPNIASYILGDVGGPTAGLATATVTQTNNKKNAERFGLGQVPLAGPYLKTRLTPFGNAQDNALARVLDQNDQTLKAAGYTPGLPSQIQRGNALNKQQYQQFLNNSTKLFVQKVQTAEKDPAFTRLSPDVQKKTLAKALSDARNKVRDNMGLKQVKTKKAKLKSY